MKALKKYFDELETMFYDAASEANLEDFSCGFDAINCPAEIRIAVQREKYVVVDIYIYNEYGEDIAYKYPLFCEEVKRCVPCYKDVERDVIESNMTPEELYFGSYQGYLKYRYG